MRWIMIGALGSVVTAAAFGVSRRVEAQPAQCVAHVDPAGEGAGVHFDDRKEVRVKVVSVQAGDAAKFTLQNSVGRPEVDLKGAKDKSFLYAGPVKLSVCSTEPGSGGGCWSTPTYRPGFAEFRTPKDRYTVQLEVSCP